MLPYLPPPAWPVHGMLAVLALVVGHHVFVRQLSQRTTVSPWFAEIAAIAIVTAGLLAGHTLALVQTEQNLTWRAMMRIDQGQSSLGLLAGGMIMLAALARHPGMAFRPALDAAALAFVAAWPLVRLGCAWTHDSLGAASRGRLAVAFPSGSRFDVGLLEWLATPFLVALAWQLRRHRMPGVLAGAVGGLYLLVRAALYRWTGA